MKRKDSISVCWRAGNGHRHNGRRERSGRLLELREVNALGRRPLSEHLVFFRAERRCWKSAIKPINRLARPLWLNPESLSEVGRSNCNQTLRDDVAGKLSRYQAV